MQVGRASWAGQTFALAKCSDSQGKKQRSRMTREERRKMVESFIGRHRASNNGNFPSLNLTHKEVGGSFYTVREIVREIIQENRVLCPGNANSPSYTLDDSPSLTVEPPSLQRWEKVSANNESIYANGVLPNFSSMVSDHLTTNNIILDIAHSSNGICIGQVLTEEPNVRADEEKVTLLEDGEISHEETIAFGKLQSHLPSSQDEVSSFVRDGIASDLVGCASEHVILEEALVPHVPDLQEANALSSFSECLKLEPLASTGELNKDLDSGVQLTIAETNRKSSDAQQTNSGENPFWAIIKGFVSSFVKFWGE